MAECYIIAEAGLNHNGSVDIAKQLIDVAAVARANAVKFQKRNVASLAIRDVLEANDDRFPSLGITYREVRESLELSFDDYCELKDYSKQRGLDFICTPFDMESVDFLEKVGLDAYKIASHSVTNLQLLHYITNKAKRVILSSGMCTLDELDQAVDILKQGCEELTLLHCVSSYPQAAEESNLQLLQVLRDRYRLPVGYSGHELGYLPSLVAVAMGACMVERHYTLDHSMVGFDHKISLEPHELIAMVRDIRRVEAMKQGGVKTVTEKESMTRRKYHVSMTSTVDIHKGTVIAEDMVTYKNPGGGIAPKDAASVIGKAARVDIKQDTLIRHSMIETQWPQVNILAICPVLGEFVPVRMERLMNDLLETRHVSETCIISDRVEVKDFAEHHDIRHIERPVTLQSPEASIEDVLQYTLKQLEQEGLVYDFVLYANYLFPSRPLDMLSHIIEDVVYNDFDTVFPAVEDYHNYWKRDMNGNFSMIGNWLSRPKKEPMYRGVNGLGTVTRASFIRNGLLIGDKTGVYVLDEYEDKIAVLHHSEPALGTAL